MNKNYISQLKEILRAGAFTQSALAERIGVTFAALSRWLNGRARPHPRRLLTIAKLHRRVVGFPELSSEELTAIERRAARLRRNGLWGMIAKNEALQNELLVVHTYNSTSIEGTTLSQKETEVVVLEKGVIPGKPLREHLEVANHASVLRDIFKKNYREPLGEILVKTMHKSLLQGVRDDAGAYSKHPRVIRGLDIELTHPKDIPEEMSRLLRSWNRASHKTVREIAVFHSQFELIHPFGDGNGRIGRLLMALHCLERGHPPVVIETSRKAEYYEVLEYAQTRSEGPLIAFLTDEMERTARIIRRYV